MGWTLAFGQAKCNTVAESAWKMILSSGRGAFFCRAVNGSSVAGEAVSALDLLRFLVRHAEELLSLIHI